MSEPQDAKKAFFAAIDETAGFPGVAATIRATAARPNATAADVAVTIERDVGFATRLLRIVNAPDVGLVRPCVSVAQAVSLVGLGRIGTLADAAASEAILDRCTAISPKIASLSVDAAALARVLGPVVGSPPETAYTATLLAHIGLLAMVAAKQLEYSPWEFDHESSPAEERSVLGFDHAELGSDILLRWNLPSPVPDVVALQYDHEAAYRCGRVVGQLVAVARLALRIVHHISLHATVSPAEAAGFLDSPVFVRLGLEPAALVEVWPKLRVALGLPVGEETPKTPVLARPPAMRHQAPSSAEPTRSPHGWLIAAATIAVPIAGVVAAFLLR